MKTWNHASRIAYKDEKKKTYTHNVVELKIQKLRRRILSKSNFHSFQWCQRERKHIHCICHHKEWIVYIRFFFLSTSLLLSFSLSFCKFAVKSFLLASALCKQVHRVLSVVYKGNRRKVLDDDDDDAKHPVLIVWKQNFHTFFFLS